MFLCEILTWCFRSWSLNLCPVSMSLFWFCSHRADEIIILLLKLSAVILHASPICLNNTHTHTLISVFNCLLASGDFASEHVGHKSLLLLPHITWVHLQSGCLNTESLFITFSNSKLKLFISKIKYTFHYFS